MAGKLLRYTGNRARSALIVATMLVTACSGEADFSDSMPEPVILSAEEYQAEIVEIDRLVFGEGPFDDDRRETLAGRLDELAARMKSSSDSRFISLEALEIRRLAAIVRRFPVGAPRGPVENDWMRIRSNVFDDRGWFARSAADLDQLAAAPVEAAAGPAAPETSFAAPRIIKAGSLHDLDGNWTVDSIHGDGMPISDAEMSAAVWIFEGGRLTIQPPSGTFMEYTVRKVEDEKGTALRLESTGRSKAENGWMIYRISDGQLTLAFFDGLGGRPEGFTPPPENGEPMFVVVNLSPAVPNDLSQ